MQAHYQPIAAVAVLILATPITQAQLLSQCLKDGTEVEMQCSLVDDVDHFSWELDWDYTIDYDSSEAGRDISFNATWSGTDHDIQEVSCDFVNNGKWHYFHAVIIVTDHRATLPIFPVLERGRNGSTLTLTWDNPRTTFVDDDNVYFNYTVSVNTSEGLHYTQLYDVESHDKPNRHLHLSECQHVDISISLPGNCEDKKISGSMPIVPKQFQHNATSIVLFSGNGNGQHVQIKFTPPELCPSQPASYILSFDDGNETWSTEPEPISDSSVPVVEYMELGEDTESRLRREESYTVSVTVITEYANVTSTADFSTHSLLGIGPINLKVKGYRQGSVEVAWYNPHLLAASFTYKINVSPLNSKDVVKSLQKSFHREKDPFISIDLNGYECTEMQITVAVLGAEDEAESVTAVVPSYSMTFGENVHVDTSLNKDNTVREAEITFKPPLVCEFQNSSYILTVSEAGSDGNEIWSNRKDPVEITDPNQQVKVEMESGLEVNTDYIATVTVFTPYANISSSASFRFQLPTGQVVLPLDDSSGVSSAMVGGVVGGVVILLLVVLLCGFGAGLVAVYGLRQRKRNKQKNVERSARGCMVINPLYGDSDGLYEELPENVTTSVTITASTAMPVQPNVPPPRLAGQTDLPKNGKDDKLDDKLAGCLSSTHDTHSISSSCRHDDTEDCYTVMSPAGTLTMLPRNRHSAASLGGSVPWPMGGAP